MASAASGRQKDIRLLSANVVSAFCCALLLIFCNIILGSGLVNAVDATDSDFAPATGPQHDKVVVCYWGTWSVYRPGRGAFSLEHIDPNLCTHIIYSFAGLNAEENSMKALDPWNDLAENYGKDGYQRFTKLRERYPHLKLSLAIGGWNEGSVSYSALAMNATRRSNFVENALKFIRKYNFDGLDLDWEYPTKRGGAPEDKANFLLLVKELKAAFKKHNLLLTAALGASKETISAAYDVAGLSVYLDYIHLMCYDYHGAWDHKTGPNAPLHSFSSDDTLNVAASIEYMLELGAPPSKLVMGIPLYGRTFITVEPIEQPPAHQQSKLMGMTAKQTGFQGPFTREDGFMGYNEICMELRNTTRKWQRRWDATSRTPYALIAGEHRFITYEDADSISHKVRFAMKHKLAGAMVWSIDTDDFHGDCADKALGSDANFPLMRAINQGIVQSLKDIDETKDNEIDTESYEDGAASISQLTILLIVICSTSALLLG